MWSRNLASLTFFPMVQDHCNGNTGTFSGLGGRMGSEINDDTVEPLAYAVCNTDGVEGLSWAEVEQCEVSKNKYKLKY